MTRPQFSLAGLLIVVAICGVALGTARHLWQLSADLPPYTLPIVGLVILGLIALGITKASTL